MNIIVGGFPDQCARAREASFGERAKSPEEIGRNILTTLALQAERNRQAGSALRAEIRAVMVEHEGRDRLTAQRVRAALTREPRPSIRRIQEHMQALRAESSASR